MPQGLEEDRLFPHAAGCNTGFHRPTDLQKVSPNAPHMGQVIPGLVPRSSFADHTIAGTRESASTRKGRERPEAPEKRARRRIR